MNSGSTQSPNTTHVEVATLALLNAYPVGLRQWGMSITVESENKTYVLKKGRVDENKANNANWGVETLDTTETQSNVTHRASVGIPVFKDESGSVWTGHNITLLEAIKIPNKSVVQMEVFVEGITSDDTGGFAGTLTCSWWKSNAGVLQKINDTFVINKSSALGGETITLASVDSAGNITLSVNRTVGIKSYRGSAMIKSLSVISIN